MDVAVRFSQLSTAVRLKVGCIIVKDDRIISIGYNGMPSGWNNCCEDSAENSSGNIELITKKEVLHAEMNALMKLAKSTESGNTAAIFITHSPCINCAKGVYQTGIKEVYYKNAYGTTDGLNFLEKCGLKLIKV